MTAISTTDLLDLNVPTRADAFRYELTDQFHNTIGTLVVDESSPPTVHNDTSRSTFRTCSNLSISATDLSQIDTLRDRVRISIVLQNGDVWPLGVFMFGTDNRTPYSWGTTWKPDLFDETLLVDQPLDNSYGLAPGQSIMQLVNLLVGQVGLPAVDFSAVQDRLTSEAVPTIQAGYSRSKAIADLVKLLGAFGPYFDNQGAYRIKPFPTAAVSPDHVYELGGRIVYGTTVLSNSVYRAPNRYQVVSSPTGAPPIVGTYDLPAAAPNSYANTGRLIIASRPLPGLPDQATANLVAYGDALIDSRSNYVQATFSSTADPRHDTFELVQLLGVQYLEKSWDLECRTGGLMNHSVVGYYGQ